MARLVASQDMTSMVVQVALCIQRSWSAKKCAHNCHVTGIPAIWKLQVHCVRWKKICFYVQFIIPPCSLLSLKGWTHQTRYRKNLWHSTVTHSLIEKSSSCCIHFSWLVTVWIVPLFSIKSLGGDFYCAVFAFLQHFPEIVNSFTYCTNIAKKIKLCIPFCHAHSEKHILLPETPTYKSR